MIGLTFCSVGHREATIVPMMASGRVIRQDLAAVTDGVEAFGGENSTGALCVIHTAIILRATIVTPETREISIGMAEAHTVVVGSIADVVIFGAIDHNLPIELHK